MAEGAPLFRVRNLEQQYPVTEGLLRREVDRVAAVDGVSFEVRRGETLGLVGESGCGKSTTATTALRLEEPTGGTVRFDGEDVLGYDEAELKAFRRRAQMVFQHADGFDPRMTVGESVGEPLLIHGVEDRERRREVVEDLLERVGMSADDADRYPHTLSGGQRQRVALARALVLDPDLLVADEPVSALDVSVQAEVLSLLDELQSTLGLGVLLISHDLGVVREVCDRVAVMYLGEIVEVAPAGELFADPQHPYTRALLDAIPDPDPRNRGGRTPLTGDVPSPSDPPSGCRFHTRCPEVIQPEEYDLDQGDWRAVRTLRSQVVSGEVDLAAAREVAAAERDGPPEAVDAEAVAAAVREEFDVPPELTDPAAEAVLSTALGELVRGDRAAAERHLAAAFATPCEERHPELVETGADHPAACLRHYDDVSASAE